MTEQHKVNKSPKFQTCLAYTDDVNNTYLLHFTGVRKFIQIIKFLLTPKNSLNINVKNVYLAEMWSHLGSVHADHSLNV